MPLLVISSCTKEKCVTHPDQLSLEDFRNPARRASREVLLAHLRRPAAEMYTGDQHLEVMAGLHRLRSRFGPQCARLCIISAGYGLVEEADGLLPYQATFDEMTRREARAWAQQLGIPDRVREVVQGHSLVIFLLGDNYLRAIVPPLTPATGQRFVFLVARAGVRKVMGRGVTAVVTGAERARLFGSTNLSLKGKMFHLLAQAVASDERHLEAIRGDDTSASFERAMHEAQARR